MHKPSKSLRIVNPKSHEVLAESPSKNSELFEKIEHIKDAIHGLSDKMNEEVDTLNGISNEHDKEIQNVRETVRRMDNNLNIINNEISRLNEIQEDQDLLTKELVKETQENYKSMLLLKSMIRNQTDVMRNSIKIDEFDPAKGSFNVFI